MKALDADEDAAAEIDYSIYENESSGVKELFTINRNTGEITLLKSAIARGKIQLLLCTLWVKCWLDACFAENQVFQFFVRAQDRGSPPLHSDMPVEVYIMAPEDTAPMFERRDDKFFISEYSQPGKLLFRSNNVEIICQKNEVNKNSINTD